MILVALTSGCGDLADTGQPVWTWREPELLYLLADPCDRLHVEVDTIEGLEPPTESLERLEAVLREYCDKPVGIRIAAGGPIPLAEARGKPPRLLALLNIDGPPATDAEDRTAYMYVLFYDSKRLGLPEAEPPHVDRYYPGAIYIDMAYSTRITRHLPRQIITHELGHALGLSKDVTHRKGPHCRNSACVMSSGVRVPAETWLLGIAPPVGLQTHFCRRCRRDLRPARTQPSSRRMSFRGPILVRKEEDYSVAFLPGFIRLWFDKDTDPHWPDLQARLRPLVRRHRDSLGGGAGFLYCRDTPQALRGKQAAVARAARDPNPVVAQVAAGLLEQLRAHAGSSVLRAHDEARAPSSTDRPAASVTGL